MTRTAGADWKTTLSYDDAGRPSRVDYQDGSSATTTYNPDSTVKTQTTREGLTLTYTYDAANRPLSVVPSGTPGSGMAPLDNGIETTSDALSRPTSQRRAADPRLAVEHPEYDLGSRPLEEKVGAGEALGWAWDIYNRPVQTKLPVGIGRSAGAFEGFARSYNGSLRPDPQPQRRRIHLRPGRSPHAGRPFRLLGNWRCELVDVAIKDGWGRRVSGYWLEVKP